MRRGFPMVLGVLAVAGMLGTDMMTADRAPAAAQAPTGKMVIFEFFERIT